MAAVDVSAAASDQSDSLHDPWARLRLAVYGVDADQHGWTTLDELERIAGWLRAGPGARVLDVGCGIGGLTRLLATLTRALVVGIDLGPGPRGDRGGRSSSRGPSSTPFVQADAAASLPFAPRSFDAICCIDAVPHLGPLDRVLSQWRRLLAGPGSRLIVIDPTVPGTDPADLSADELALRTGTVAYELRTAGAFRAALERRGFAQIEQIDLTPSLVAVAEAWHEGVEGERATLERLAGREAVDHQVDFCRLVIRLGRSRRLSRIAHLAVRGPDPEVGYPRASSEDP